MSNDYFNCDDSPNKTNAHLQLPSPIITRRNRTASTSERALGNPIESGKINVEGEFVPLPGDEVIYRLCPIPPKFEKNQAVHVRINHLTPEKHQKWSEPQP
ncbi:hypothetical protein NE865_13623 [Phthorimaea operculella]|nr:hypothetical protein NE865_13623 [Phthorimaea operculella]